MINLNNGNTEIKLSSTNPNNQMLNKNQKVMKTRILTVSLMLMAVVLFSCKKDKVESSGPQEVSFQADQIIPNGGLKSTSEFDVKCSDIEPTNAHIVIEGVKYDPSVYRVDGKLYTQAIKLDPGSYTVTEFFLYKESGTAAGYDAGDKIVMATPAAGSPYAAYTTPDLDFDFTVTAFAKTQVPIQVLCFAPEAYTDFGFGWFSIGEVVLREACFFGDICLNGEPFTPSDFNGSLYGNNVGVDVPAIMNIIVKRGGVVVPNSPFTNEGALTSPLCVQYPDYVGQVDNFTFELQLWLPGANGFSYQTYAIYTATDDGALNVSPGDDGVFDFVVGTCGYGGDADQTFEFLYTPPVPPVVKAGYVSGGTKKGNVRWRNLMLNGTGGEIYVGTDCNNSATRSELEFYGTGSQYFFAPDANSISVSYDPNTGILSTSTGVNNVLKNLNYSVGNVGLINYLQWQVNGDPGKTLEFNNVKLTVGGQTYNLGSFETEYGDWYIDYDLSSGFSLTGEMVINGQATSQEGMKLEISLKQF